MTQADYLAGVQRHARECNRPFDEADLRPDQRVTISTARLMGMQPGDCELLVCGELVPWREGA